MTYCFANRVHKPSRVKQIERTTMKNGYKKYVKDSQGIYKGEWKDDMRQGYGIMNYLTQKVYVGYWAANKRNGYGVLKKKIGNQYKIICMGEWFNNRIANGKCYLKDGIYDGSYTVVGIRMKNGYGTMDYNDGTKYRGDWHNDQYHGIGSFVGVNGNYYYGQWCNSVKHGKGIYVFKDKNQFMEGVWVNGLLKVNVIQYLKIPTAIKQPMMPEILDKDKECFRKVYEDAESEALKEL